MSNLGKVTIGDEPCKVRSGNRTSITCELDAWQIPDMSRLTWAAYWWNGHEYFDSIHMMKFCLFQYIAHIIIIIIIINRLSYKIFQGDDPSLPLTIYPSLRTSYRAIWAAWNLRSLLVPVQRQAFRQYCSVSSDSERIQASRQKFGLFLTWVEMPNSAEGRL